MKRFTTLVLILFFVMQCAKKNEEIESTLTKTGQPVPEFTVTTLDGHKINIAEQKGKVVLINFFADWCPPCNEEMPHLENEIWQKYKDKDFLILSIGREHNNDEVAAYKKKKEVTFPMASDPDRSIYSKFATQFIPRNYIINKDGRIVFQEKGFDKDKLKEMIDKIEEVLM